MILIFVIGSILIVNEAERFINIISKLLNNHSNYGWVNLDVILIWKWDWHGDCYLTTLVSE